jgi:chemotaxis protein methyltransferase CheR
MRPALASRRSGEPWLISDQAFERFRALILEETGIMLSAAKKALLTGRLTRRLRELGVDSFEAYFDRVVADPGERVEMLDRVTTNETHFFREPRHFKFLAEEVFPAWRAEAQEGRRARVVRAWSAGCSSGEEPYSLAMTLLEAFPPGSGWEVEVLGTDLSTRVLARAGAAVWPIAKAQEIPEPMLQAFMLQGTGPSAGVMKAGPELRARVAFRRLNLNDAAYGLPRFDLVFCRNVLIYFDAAARDRALGRLLSHVDERGYFFVGHAESLANTRHPVRHVGATVYARASGTPGR